MKLSALFKRNRDRPVSMSVPSAATPPWLMPFVLYLTRLQVEDLALLGLRRQQLAQGSDEPLRQRITADLAARLQDDGSWEFHAARIQIAVDAGRRAVETALTHVHDLMPPDEHRRFIDEAVADLAATLATQPELDSADFNVLWGPYQDALPHLERLRRGQAFWFRDSEELESILRMEGLAEGLIPEGTQVSPEAWDGVCAICGAALPSIGWEKSRLGAVVFCEACPTVVVKGKPRRADGSAMELITFIQFFPRGSLLASPGVDSDPDHRFGPESDWVEGLLRLPGEFAPITWQRVIEAHIGAALTTSSSVPPRELLKAAVDHGQGSAFQAHCRRAHAAVLKSADENNLDSLPERSRQRCESVLSQIAFALIARPFVSESRVRSEIDALQRAMDEVAGHRTRSLVEMLEQEAWFRAKVRESQKAAAEATQVPPLADIEDRVLSVLRVDEGIEEVGPNSALHGELGLDDIDIARLIESAAVVWQMSPVFRSPAPISDGERREAQNVGDIVALIARSLGHDVPFTPQPSGAQPRFEPMTDEVFDVIRQARRLSPDEGERLQRRYQNLPDTVRKVRRAVKDAMWAARQAGRAPLVKDARRLADRTAVGSLLAMAHDNLSHAAWRETEGASQFAVFAVTGAATRDLISEDCYEILTRQWRIVVLSGAEPDAMLGSSPPKTSGSSGSSATDAMSSGSSKPDGHRAPAWTATGSMFEAHHFHTATLLPDGKVLVVGGGGSSGSNSSSELEALASAELYDASNGSWTTTGSMITTRTAHTSTLLPDGRVLVVGGGSSSSSDLASAELYDPSSGFWTATGSMFAARAVHTATLLADGQVLVAGGADSMHIHASRASAELYDPSRGSWTATGSMVTPRQRHTATLLADGKVLVAGGASSRGALTSAELYDPSSGSWTAIGNMDGVRVVHTATLLSDGKVLVAGGSSGSGGALTSAELYDPNSRSWAAIGNMHGVRSGHTGTLLPDGRVLVAGGSSHRGRTLAVAELYDPSSGSWIETVSMTATRAVHTATLLPEGKVLVAGGGDIVALASAELYDSGVGN